MILAGIHAAADIIVQLLLALFAIVLNPLVTGFAPGYQPPGCHNHCGYRDADCPHRPFRRAGRLAERVLHDAAAIQQRADAQDRGASGDDAVSEPAYFAGTDVAPDGFRKIMTYATTLMTGLSGAMASILLLVMTVVFMLFEVRHVPYKLRFALNNPQIHIAGLHRALKGVSKYLALKPC